MKIKNINFFEKHLEKLILGVGVVCSLSVIYLYVIGNPYTVTTPSGTLTPVAIDDRLLSTTRSLELDLASPKSGIDPITIPEYTKEFIQKAFRTPLSPVPILKYPWSVPGLDPSVFKEVGPAPVPIYIVPDLPAPKGVIAKADFARLESVADAQQRDQLMKLTNAVPPGDFFYVTVSATFDMNEWRDKILQTEAERRIKDEWRRSSYYITIVQLIRSEWEPEKQDWSAPIRIPILPGNPDFANKTENNFNTNEANALVNEIRASQNLIYQPPFLRVDSKRPWQGVEQANPNDLIKRLNADLEDLQRKLDALKASNVGGRTTPAKQAEERDLNAKIQSLREQLNALLAPSPNLPAIAAAFNPTAGRAEDGQLPVYKVWAHDVSVVPNRRYRYKLELGVLNPLFQKGQDLNASQKLQENDKLNHMANIQNEPWIEVDVPRDSHFFVVNASRSSNPIDSYADVEVWKVFNAGWLRQNFRVQPGDSIGQLIEAAGPDKNYQVDLKTGTTVVDLTFSTQNSTGQQSGQIILVTPAEKLTVLDTDAQAKDPVRLKLLEQLGAPAVAPAANTPEPNPELAPPPGFGPPGGPNKP